jgi:hypothetical protein
VAAQVGGVTITVLAAEDGNPLPGAMVTLKSDRGLVAPTTLVTGNDGVAEFPVLRAGSGYLIEISLPGFASRRAAGLRVSSGVIARLEVLLSPEIQERIDVRAKASVVELDSVGNASKFDDIFIEHLPITGRFYQNALSFAPGIQDVNSDGNPNVHGGRARDFRAEIGGISNTDPLTGQWLSRVNSESIEEMEILSSGAGVEFGRASAGFARIIQKQGSNDFEGVFSFIYRSSDLDGGGATGVSEERLPEFDWVQPSLQLSGPIVKDRLWFRFSHEHIDREDPVDLITRVDTIAFEQSMHSDQITWQVSPRNKLAFQYQSDPLRIENYNLSSKVSPESAQTFERGGDEFRLIWTAPQSARLLFDTTAAWQDSYQNILPTTSGYWNGCVEFELYPGLNRARCYNVDTGRYTGSYHESWRDKRQRLTFRTQATWYAGRFLGMSHRFKFGFISENERFYRDLDRGPDIYFDVDNTSLAQPPPASVTARLSAPRESVAEATGVNWALYAEDQMHPLDNLAITLGLRFDRMEITAKGLSQFDPQAEADAFFHLLDTGYWPFHVLPRVFTAHQDIQEFQNSLANVLGIGAGNVPVGSMAQSSAFWWTQRELEDNLRANNDVSPRLSVAWDPWSDGKTKLALSAGRYYDKIFLAVPLLELEPPTTTILIDAYRPSLDYPYLEEGRADGIKPTASVQMVDRNLRTPYQDELSLSVERMLWPETSVKLTYLKRKYRDQLQDIDINHQVGDEGFCLIAGSMSQPVIAPSDGEGQTIVDRYTGEHYIDTDPGRGDGRIDDCMGGFRGVGGTFGEDIPTRDGLPDLYVLNPGWGELLMVGNFNTSEYKALVLELVRRQYRNWQMNASYTWSEAIGDAEDFNQILGNERTLFEDEYGYLSWDQRHVVKVSAISITPWGFRLGGVVRWESGLPFSVLHSRLTAFSIPPDYGMGDPDLRYRYRYPTGQRNDQRNPDYWTFDMRAVKEFSLPKGVNLQLTAEVFNMLNDNTLRVDERVNGENTGTRRFGRRYQLGLRVSF